MAQGVTFRSVREQPKESFNIGFARNSLMEEPVKQLFSAALVGAALIGSGATLAQTPLSSSPTPPAIATSKGDSNTTAAPVAGMNSFTEGGARDRLEKHGYTAVSGLMKDDRSIWRGTAMKDGKSVAVAVDYQGNIVAK